MLGLSLHCLFDFDDTLHSVTNYMTQINFFFEDDCPPLWMGKLVKVSFYSTVDEFKISGAVAIGLKIG